MNTEKNPWKQISSEVSYDNGQFKVRKDDVVRPDGNEGKYFVIEIPTSVAIVVVDELNEAYLVGQYRYTSGLYSWEVPGGATDNQDPLEAAKRELREETGIEVTTWDNLGIIHALSGRTNKVFHVFLARSIQTHDENSQEEERITRMEKFSFTELFRMIGAGEITNSETISSLMKAAIKLRIVKCS